MEQPRIISPAPDTFADYFRQVWRYRSLIWVFARRDLDVKYAQTFIGIGWTLLQPLTGLLIFTFFFGVLLNWKSGDLPYPLYVLSGLLGWNFFSYIVHSGSASVQESAGIIRKIYFPKSILPLSKVLVALTELGFSLLLLIPLMWYYGIVPSFHIVFVPFVLLFNAVCGLALVFWVAALAYRKRDLFHLLPYLVNFGIWLTPVFFSQSILPDSLHFLTDYNPMANVVSMWRWALFGSEPFRWLWILQFGWVSLALMAGMYYYSRKENTFTDFA